MTRPSQSFVREAFAALVPEAREQYQARRFAQMDRAIDGSQIRGALSRLLPIVRRYAEQSLRPPEGSGHAFNGGYRYERIDPGVPQSSFAREEDTFVRQAFEDSGLNRLVGELWDSTSESLNEIVGTRLALDRCFLLRYRERDYIAPHGDSQKNGRVLVQLPVPFNTVGVFRAMTGEWFEDFYDRSGSLRILGPGIIHEVPPVLRTNPEADPERIIVTIRLRPA